MINDKKHFETLAIREQEPITHQKEHSVPLYLTSSFRFDSAEEASQIFSGEKEGNVYSRYGNPNTEEFARKMAFLEGAEDGLSTASGMAAVYLGFVAYLSAGDHVLVSRSIFGNTHRVVTEILPRMGVEVDFIDLNDHQAWADGVRKNTKLLYIETPANPTLLLADMAFLSDLCKTHGIIFSVDNCFATSYLQRPLELGADLVMHSATKYIDGQGRVLGGCLLGSEELISRARDFMKFTGPTLSPFNAWVLSKSLETLSVRMDRHCDNAEKLVDFLENSSEVEGVVYPYQKSNPQYELALKQMDRGGGLVGCYLKGGLSRGQKFLNALSMHSLTANLGDTRSIATHPASTTHSKLSPEERLQAGVRDNYVRFSVGLEHITDIIEDIEIALNSSK